MCAGRIRMSVLRLFGQVGAAPSRAPHGRGIAAGAAAAAAPGPLTACRAVAATASGSPGADLPTSSKTAMESGYASTRVRPAAMASGSPGADPPSSKTAMESGYASTRVRPGDLLLNLGQPGRDQLQAALALLRAAAAHRLSPPAGGSGAERGADDDLLAEPGDPFLLQYPPRRGYRAFREDLAVWLSERSGARVEADEIMITGGCSHGLDLCLRHLSSPGDCIYIESPTYFLTKGIVSDAGLNPLPVAVDEGGLDVAALEADCARRAAAGLPPARLLYTVSCRGGKGREEGRERPSSRTHLL